MKPGVNVDNKRRAGAAALAIALHAAALLTLVTQAVHRFAPETTPRRDVDLEIVPDTTVAPTAKASDGLASSALGRRASPNRTSTRSAIRVVAPSDRPAFIAAPPGGVETKPDAAPSGASSEGGTNGDLRGMLRAAVGCSHQDFLRLDLEERDRCAKAIAQAVRTAPSVDALPAEKRRYYDAVAQAYAMRRAPTPVATPSPLSGGRPTGPVSGERWAGPPGSHLPAFGCKPASVGPPHSLKVGPLPCYVLPPSGFLTEEADLPSPVSLPKDKPQ